ncbi:hypothetical protein M5K25_001867 [Dendrobium thyrsiflorum]|uniref:Transmembrane protein n=1 Tax=Dendrobium thyrsiflorum TaxID=117978 RepID=A0ABD0VR47_DENTH
MNQCLINFPSFLVLADRFLLFGCCSPGLFPVVVSAPVGLLFRLVFPWLILVSVGLLTGGFPVAVLLPFGLPVAYFSVQVRLLLWASRGVFPASVCLLPGDLPLAVLCPGWHGFSYVMNLPMPTSSSGDEIFQVDEFDVGKGGSKQNAKACGYVWLGAVGSRWFIKAMNQCLINFPSFLVLADRFLLFGCCSPGLFPVAVSAPVGLLFRLVFPWLILVSVGLLIGGLPVAVLLPFGLPVAYFSVQVRLLLWASRGVFSASVCLLPGDLPLAVLCPGQRVADVNQASRALSLASFGAVFLLSFKAIF